MASQLAKIVARVREGYAVKELLRLRDAARSQGDFVSAALYQRQLRVVVGNGKGGSEGK